MKNRDKSNNWNEDLRKKKVQLFSNRKKIARLSCSTKEKKENMIKKHDDRDEKFNSHDER